MNYRYSPVRPVDLTCPVGDGVEAVFPGIRENASSQSLDGVAIVV